MLILRYLNGPWHPWNTGYNDTVYHTYTLDNYLHIYRISRVLRIKEGQVKVIQRSRDHENAVFCHFCHKYIPLNKYDVLKLIESHVFLDRNVRPPVQKVRL